ncbi:MAG TPA: hypothetical protein VFK86_11205 [Bauldia sp.]|nr:hypothetical protein [Bauldia sp.]
MLHPPFRSMRRAPVPNLHIRQTETMRGDLAQVIIERPRRGGLERRKGRPPRDADGLPAAEGMRRPHVLKRTGKSFNDLFGPIRRYLDKQVGRPWNKVYSEICAPLRAGRLIDDHLKRHIRELVAFDVVMDESGRPRRRVAAGDYSGVFQPYFVHPRTGILKRTSRPRRPLRP